MSWWIYKFDGIQSVNSDVGGIGVCYADTEADIGSRTDFSGKVLLGGSTCHTIAEGTDWMIDSAGVWHKQPDPHTTQLDLSAYYTSSQTDSAISTALSAYSTTAETATAIAQGFALLIAPYDTAAQTDAKIAAAVYYYRGTAITADTDNHFDLNSLTSTGARYFGNSARPYLDNLPPSYPNSGGGQIRVVENQTDNRFIMTVTSNTVAASGVIWRRWYTSSGWSSWYKYEGVVDA